MKNVYGQVILAEAMAFSWTYGDASGNGRSSDFVLTEIINIRVLPIPYITCMIQVRPKVRLWQYL